VTGALVMYRQRKKVAVERAREFISKDPNKNWITEFDKSKKKDDLADTVMQALSYINKTPETPAAQKGKMPRKPTENQKQTKYSKANLAYLLKNGAPNLE